MLEGGLGTKLHAFWEELTCGRFPRGFLTRITNGDGRPDEKPVCGSSPIRGAPRQCSLAGGTRRLKNGISFENWDATVDSSTVEAPAGSVELLEREAQLSSFKHLLEAVQRTRRGRLVLVRGEAGIGKTAVIRRFCEEQRPPLRILWGACEALFAPPRSRACHRRCAGHRWRVRAGCPRGAHPHEVVSALIREVTDSCPTVLVLEDLHWADEATLDVLRLLGRRIEAVPALVVATYRDDELGKASPLRVVLGELARTPGIERVELVRLSPEAAATLAAPHGVDAEALYRSTAGNPFFVTEVLAGSAEEIPSTAPEAAKQASDLGAHRESAAQYSRALRFAGSSEPMFRAQLLQSWSYECMMTDRIDESLNALRAAIALHRRQGDVRAEGRALQELSSVLWCPGLVAEAKEAARRAVSLLEAVRPGPELAMAYSGLAGLCAWAEEVDDAIEWGTRATELSEALDEPEISLQALQAVGAARFIRGETAGRQQLEQCLVRATDAGLDDRAGGALVCLVAAARRWRSYPLAQEHVERGLRFTSDRGVELLRGYMLAYQAQIERDLGHWQGAVEIAAIVLSEPRRSRLPRLVALTVVGSVRARRGDPDVWPPLDEALSLAERGEELQAIEPVAATRAEAAWLERDQEAVRRATDSALSLARLRAAPWVVSELAVWRRRAGIVDQVPDDETTGPYSLELAGEYSRARARWLELGCPYEAALALAGSEADGTLRQALNELLVLDAKPAADIVAQKLRARGARGLPRGPRPKTSANPAGLTAASWRCWCCSLLACETPK